MLVVYILFVMEAMGGENSRIYTTHDELHTHATSQMSPPLQTSPSSPSRAPPSIPVYKVESLLTASTASLPHPFRPPAVLPPWNMTAQLTIMTPSRHPCRPDDNDTHDPIRPEQRRHRAHPLRQPLRRLRLLRLAPHHGHLLQICRGARRDPRTCSRGYDDFLVRRGGGEWVEDHCAGAVHDAQSVHLDSVYVCRVGRDFGAKVSWSLFCSVVLIDSSNGKRSAENKKRDVKAE